VSAVGHVALAICWGSGLLCGGVGRALGRQILLAGAHRQGDLSAITTDRFSGRASRGPLNFPPGPNDVHHAHHLYVHS
jgi:hypothetical protein